MNHRRAKQTGLTLIELMIGIVVGLIIIAGTISVYVTTVQGSNYTLRSNRLNQDMRAVMDIMASDIRRAGYWSDAATAAPDEVNPFTQATTDIAILDGGACILYSYDATYQGDDIVDNNWGEPDKAADPGTDFFGFRLTDAGIVEMRNGGDTTADCNDGDWQPLTDAESVTVTALAFSTEGSRCLNASRDTNDDGINDNWVSAAGSVTPACVDAAAAPTSGDLLIETRQIVITFRGVHADDAQMETTLRDSVKVRNNRIITAP